MAMDMLGPCIICYRVDVPLSGNESKDLTKTLGTLNRFFQLLERHMIQDFDNGEDEKVKDHHPEEKLPFKQLINVINVGEILACQECSKLMESFCELYHEMKSIQLLLNWKLWSLKNIMFCAQRVPIRLKEFREVVKELDLGGDFSADEIIEFKRDLVRKCHRKLQNTFPRLILKKCETGTEKPAENAEKPVTTTEKNKAEEGGEAEAPVEIPKSSHPPPLESKKGADDVERLQQEFHELIRDIMDNKSNSDDDDPDFLITSTPEEAADPDTPDETDDDDDEDASSSSESDIEIVAELSRPSKAAVSDADNKKSLEGEGDGGDGTVTQEKVGDEGGGAAAILTEMTPLEMLEVFMPSLMELYPVSSSEDEEGQGLDPTKIYYCSQCGKPFNTKGELKEHEESVEAHAVNNENKKAEDDDPANVCGKLIETRSIFVPPPPKIRKLSSSVVKEAPKSELNLNGVESSLINNTPTQRQSSYLNDVFGGEQEPEIEIGEVQIKVDPYLCSLTGESFEDPLQDEAEELIDPVVEAVVLKVESKSKPDDDPKKPSDDDPNEDPDDPDYDPNDSDYDPRDQDYDPKTGLYDCTFCPRTFKSAYALRNHNDLIHLKIKFMCTVCDKDFNSKAIYNHHFRRAHPEMNTNLMRTQQLGTASGSHSRTTRPTNGGSYANNAKPINKCKYCVKQFETKDLMRNHVTLFHFKKVTTLALDSGKVILQYSPIVAAKPVQKPTYNDLLFPSQQRCPHCPSQFLSEWCLEYHFKSVHKGVTFQCFQCKKMFRKIGELEEHQRMTICGGDGGLLREGETVKKEDVYCDLCGKGYEWKAGLIEGWCSACSSSGASLRLKRPFNIY